MAVEWCSLVTEIIRLDDVCHCRFVPDLEDIVIFEDLVTDGGLQKETVDAAR